MKCKKNKIILFYSEAKTVADLYIWPKSVNISRHSVSPNNMTRDYICKCFVL